MTHFDKMNGLGIKRKKTGQQIKNLSLIGFFQQKFAYLNLIAFSLLYFVFQIFQIFQFSLI